MTLSLIERRQALTDLEFLPEQNPTQAEIRSQYRALALRYHPDKNKDKVTAEEKFNKITEAYQKLSVTLQDELVELANRWEHGSPAEIIHANELQSFLLKNESELGELDFNAYLHQGCTVLRKITEILNFSQIPFAIATKLFAPAIFDRLDWNLEDKDDMGFTPTYDLFSSFQFAPNASNDKLNKLILKDFLIALIKRRPLHPKVNIPVPNADPGNNETALSTLLYGIFLDGFASQDLLSILKEEGILQRADWAAADDNDITPLQQLIQIAHSGNMDGFFALLHVSKNISYETFTIAVSKALKFLDRERDLDESDEDDNYRLLKLGIEHHLHHYFEKATILKEENLLGAIQFALAISKAQHLMNNYRKVKETDLKPVMLSLDEDEADVLEHAESVFSEQLDEIINLTHTEFSFYYAIAFFIDINHIDYIEKLINKFKPAASVNFSMIAFQLCNQIANLLPKDNSPEGSILRKKYLHITLELASNITDDEMRSGLQKILLHLYFYGTQDGIFEIDSDLVKEMNNEQATRVFILNLAEKNMKLQKPVPNSLPCSYSSFSSSTMSSSSSASAASLACGVASSSSSYSPAYSSCAVAESSSVSSTSSVASDVQTGTGLPSPNKKQKR